MREENPVSMIFQLYFDDFYLYFYLEAKVYKNSRRESSAKNLNVLLKFPNPHGSYGSSPGLNKSHPQTVEFFKRITFKFS